MRKQMIIDTAVKVFHGKGYRTTTLDDEPHSWPVHEAPNDFWRFCDEGLKVLLGPSLGFEVLRSGLEDEMRMYPENRGALATVPLNPGYCRAYVHARKVRQLASDAVIWPLDADRSMERSRKYPKKK